METKQTAVEWLWEKYNSQKCGIFYVDYLQAKNMENQHSATREALHAAFKAGWMKANATNYNESFFNHYYDNL
jgi:hypothetical protein